MSILSEDEVVESLVEGNMVSDNHSELYLPMFLTILSGGLSLWEARSKYNFEVEVVRCSIGEVRGVIQLVQNWFTGISNPSRISSLG